MAPTFCQKWLAIVCQTDKEFVNLDHTILLKFHQHVVQILNKYEETSEVSIGNGNINTVMEQQSL